MSETLATVLKIAVAAVLIVALIAGGKWAIDRWSQGAEDIIRQDPGEFKTPN